MAVAENGIQRLNETILAASMSNLAAAGSQSVAAAVSVGIDIEMLNIASLETAIAATNHGDIDRVYSNLLHGSGNHLQAFKRNIRSS